MFDSTAILLYLAEKTGQLLGKPEDRPELLSWLLFIASGLGAILRARRCISSSPPPRGGYAVNRFRREADQHYGVLNDHLQGRRHCHVNFEW